MLTDKDLATYRSVGHLTVAGVFDAAELQVALDDVERWGDEFRKEMSASQEAWYLDRGSAGADRASAQLRKLDQPVSERPVFAQMARKPSLVAMVESMIGPGVSVFFSQIFMKPPEVGGPKPVHQDNFYFGPEDLDGMVTAWIALDEATAENGCLFYGDGSLQRGVVPHVAPPDQPFNLQIPPDELRCEMTAAPVPAGGVSFHHGNTFHQSSANRSQRWRRAAAFHYLRNDVQIVRPALEYDSSACVQITQSSS